MRSTLHWCLIWMCSKNVSIIWKKCKNFPNLEPELILIFFLETSTCHSWSNVANFVIPIQSCWHICQMWIRSRITLKSCTTVFEICLHRTRWMRNWNNWMIFGLLRKNVTTLGYWYRHSRRQKSTQWRFEKVGFCCTRINKSNVISQTVCVEPNW